MSKIMSLIEAADVRGRNEDIENRKEGGQHWLSFAVLQLVLSESLAISCSLALCMCLFWLESTALCVSCSMTSPGYCSLIADPLQGHSAEQPISSTGCCISPVQKKNTPRGTLCWRPCNEMYHVRITLHQLYTFSHLMSSFNENEIS